MRTTAKETPLGINAQASYLQNTGFTINPNAATHMGSSKVNGQYTFGTIINNTSLRYLTSAINAAYIQGTFSTYIYNALISIGSNKCEALGNAKPPTYNSDDPSNSQIPSDVPTWQHDGAPATTGYSITGSGFTNFMSNNYNYAGVAGQGQSASWLPYTLSNANNSITQWGFMRCFALQAWNEFNWNGGNGKVGTPLSTVQYKDFTSSFMSCAGFIDYNNTSIDILANAPTHLKGIYSNINDLSSADITGVSLATSLFGRDCIIAGKAIDLSLIERFGCPSALLQTIYKQHAMTQSLILALISAGILAEEINDICSNRNAIISKDKESLIYGAFLIIMNNDLYDILVPLNCKTQGLTSLADLLDIKKLFPNSYQTITLPLYNVVPTKTNSKTYYPIFEAGGVSPRLVTPEISEQFGPTVFSGEPPTVNSNGEIQPLPSGLGAYLKGVIPEDIAISSAAFSFAMRQIKNIKNINFEKFAQVVASTEVVNKNLPLVNGSDVPVDTTKAAENSKMLTLGSGPYGTYTASDFFGCMSGLPYNWNELYNCIKEAESSTLNSIYDQLCRLSLFQKAHCTITQTVRIDNKQAYIDGVQPRIDDLYYSVSIVAGLPGGGYGANGAPVPIVTITPNNCGSSVTATIDTSMPSSGSISTSTYSRITFSINNGTEYKYKTVTNNSSNTAPNVAWGGADAPPLVSITTEMPPVPSIVGGILTTSGTNYNTSMDTYYGNGSMQLGTSWQTTLDNCATDLINQANSEITTIANNKKELIERINTIWNYSGTQLKIEQRSRYQALPPVDATERSKWLSSYPSTITSFVDALSGYAKSTRPHMYAQTLEAISDLTNVGGQSTIAVMRQERNAERIEKLGIGLDNTIPGTIETDLAPMLITNGTLPVGKQGSGIDVVGINGDFTNPVTTFTAPSTLYQTSVTPIGPTGVQSSYSITPSPLGFIDPVSNSFVVVNSTSSAASTDSEPTSIKKIIDVKNSTPNNVNLLGPMKNGVGPAAPITNGVVYDVGSIQSGLIGDLNTTLNKSKLSIYEQLTTPNIKLATEPMVTVVVGASTPSNTGTGTVLDTGKSTYLGSMAGSRETNVVPPALNAAYTSSVLLPTTFTINDAVKTVIFCNCDCWLGG